MKKGTRLVVMDKDADGNILVRGGGGRDRTLPLSENARFAVYEGGTLQVARGDRIRVTQGGYAGSARLSNGRIVEVAGFTGDGNIRTRDGAVIDKAYGHIDYGYSVTSHASQGSTVDHVLIAQSAASGRAASQEQFYVSVSRGRKSAHVFTDDKEALRRAVQLSSARRSAHDLVREESGPAERMAEHMEKQGRLARILEAVKQNLYRGMEALERYGITRWTPARSGGITPEAIRRQQQHNQGRQR
jgi:hypothetical protein